MMKRAILSALVILFADAMPALAHSGHGSGLMDGLAHPITGIDHLLAMVAVGVWAAMLGSRAIIALPVVFVLSMIAGSGLAIGGGLTSPGAEPLIAASLLLLGGAIATGTAPNLPLAVGITAIFAFAHGEAHGLEYTAGANAGLYVAGFATTTALLHATGVGAAFAVRHYAHLQRAFGCLTAAVGVTLLAA